MKRFLPLLLLPVLAQASDFATGGTEILLDGGATAVHVFTASGTITLDKAQFAQLLLVGGGGGGGHDCAGGGGGGGVVEVRKTRLPAGTYTVAVGAGGAGCTSGGAAGGNGGASSIADGNGTVLYRALGGGGGGGWGAPPPSSSPSAPFASGGGGTNGRSGATTGDAAQGFSGGNSSGNSACPAGGGGAGGPASPETVTAGKGGQSGSGGPGVTSDIAGTEEMYGAGGGGGGYDHKPGTGGDGIGGHGWRYGTTPTGDEPGRDGYGGGGGGGNNNGAPGGNGGSGTVIFRFAGSSATTPEPEFTWDATTVNPDSLVFSVMATSAGTAATEEAVDLFAEVAGGADAWDAQGAFSGTRKALVSGAELGAISARAYGLRPSHGYFVRLVLANDGGEEAVSDIRFFTTAQLSEPRYVLDGRTGAPGLYQLQLTGDNLLDAEMDLDSPALTVQRGAVAAGIANHGESPNAPYNGGYTDENGLTWTIGALINYRYSGWMLMEAGATYAFFGCYWDGVRFDLDGTTRIRTGGSDRTFSYACTRTGWHTVDLWFGTTSGRLGVVPGWSSGFGWNTNGVTSTSGGPGDAWARLENGCGGDAYLRTVPEGRTVDIASWSADADAGTATFTAALGESFDDTDLYAVWGPWHGGDATNGWAHVERVGSAAFGTAAATATFVVGDISDLGYFRFVAIDDKPLLSWSPSQLVDLANPAVLIAGVTHDGDRATVSIRVDSVGTGDFSLRLLWGESADLSGASVTNVPTSGPGTYDVTVPVRPGATIYYRVEATTTDGGHDATAIASFTTRAGSVLSETPTASVNKHTVNFSCSLAPAGAGTTAVTLWIGESPDALVADPDPILTSTDVKFTFTRVLDGWPRTYYWKLTCTNAAAGGTSWTDESAVRIVSTTEEGIGYRWAAGSTNGNWTVTNNWTTSTPGALGYPATNYCSASFPNGTEATIDVPAGVYFVRLVFETTCSRIVLRGEGAETTGFATGDDGGAAMSGTTFAFDNLFVEEQDVFDYAFGWDAAAGAVLALTNGAVMRLGGYTQGFFGTNSCLRVGEGSALYMDDPDVPHRYIGRNARYGSHLVLASAGEAFRVEGRASVRRLNLVPPDDEHGLVVRLRGPDAQIKVTSGVLADNYESEWSGLPMLYDADIVFEPMSGGYTNTIAYAVDGTTYTNAVPLVSVSSSGRPLGAMQQAESVGTIRISVDTSSMKRSVKSAKQHFVLWKHGIDTTRVELVPGHAYTLRYTYGWPSVLDEPENAGDLPTGIFGYVPAQAGSLLMLR